MASGYWNSSVLSIIKIRQTFWKNHGVYFSAYMTVHWIWLLFVSIIEVASSECKALFYIWIKISEMMRVFYYDINIFMSDWFFFLHIIWYVQCSCGNTLIRLSFFFWLRSDGLSDMFFLQFLALFSHLIGFYAGTCTTFLLFCVPEDYK